MRGLIAFAAILGAASAAMTSLFPRADKSGFTVARAGGVDKIVVTKQNTLNGIYHIGVPKTVNRFLASKAMTLEFVNNFGGGRLKAYIQGLDPEGRVVFIKPDGSLYYPTSRRSSTPVVINNKKIAIVLPGRGRRFRMSLPVPITSGRVYFSEGRLKFFMVKTPDGDALVQPSVADPNDPSSETSWGFVEFTYTLRGAVNANISYVDFVGMILSMSLRVKDGPDTQWTKGLGSRAVSSICNGLHSQSSSDGRNWKALCVVNRFGKPIRVISPNIYAVTRPNDFRDYWQGYVDQVWRHFAKTSLIINTQGSAGKVRCRVRGSQMRCAGDNRWYGKPSAKDIWGCDSGTFGEQDGDNDVHLAVIARLCAAFNRSTLLLAGGQLQPRPPATSYYRVNPTNHYSRLVHRNEVDGRGYAFSYDDVNPNGENASGVLFSEKPDILSIYVGGHLS
ncbi:hypothetical protein E4U41_006454 [Claviceps citrina]|nr:hypothetical protein E4U41_006454 [Claviceps citrina]